jgi:hypothetical protein
MGTTLETPPSPPDWKTPEEWTLTPYGMSRDGMHALDCWAGLDAEGVVQVVRSPSFTPEQERELQDLVLDLHAMPEAAEPYVTSPEPVAAGKYQPRSLLDFVSAPLAEPRWAVEGVWADGASGIIAGRPKDGKSTLASELAVSLWSATPMFGLRDFPVRTAPAGILYVQQENADSRVQADLQRIMAARGLGSIEHEDFLLPDGTPETLTSFVPSWDWIAPDEEPPPFELLSLSGFNLGSQEDMKWLASYVIEHRMRYVFLDPFYMLAPNVADTGTDPALKPILNALTRFKQTTACAPILTVHMSEKGENGNEPSAMLGSTYLHGWYEAWIGTRRATGGTFDIRIDALRDGLGERRLALLGQGVGSWRYFADAQDAKDADGREAPRVVVSRSREAYARELANEGKTVKEIAEQVGVTDRTVRRYLKPDDGAESDGTESNDLFPG